MQFDNSDPFSSVTTLKRKAAWPSGSQSVGPGFESRSGRLLDLFSVVPNSNPRSTGCLLPVGVFTPVTLYLNYLFLSQYLIGLPVN